MSKIRNIQSTVRADNESWGEKSRFIAAVASIMTSCLFPVLAQAAEIQVNPQPVNFMGVQTTGVVRDTVNYTYNGMSGVTTINPLGFESASLLAAQGLENPYMQALSNDLGAGWSYTFNTNATIADNTFQVHTYEALGPTPPASNNDGFVSGNRGNCVTDNDCVGSSFYFTYNPTGDDPTSNVHWLQVLYDNYANGMKVAPYYEIDTNAGTVPYYDAGYTASSSGFLDRPYTHRPGDNTTFDAMLLLVSGPDAGSPGQMTIYGGLTWGWSNQITAVPLPAACWLFASGLAGLAGLARRRNVT